MCAAIAKHSVECKGEHGQNHNRHHGDLLIAAKESECGTHGGKLVTGWLFLDPLRKSFTCLKSEEY